MRVAAAVMAGAVVLGAAGMGRGESGVFQPQTTQSPTGLPLPSTTRSPSPPQPDASVPMTRGHMEEEQAKSRAVERQKTIVSDTEKLLSLATELKTDVDKTDKNVMSLDVIKKADEIEKLAHNVKERMKGA